ncbi:acyltransferase family protein [Krasilnikovia sp. MM14-A1004]|uniref:acyltransferase family protein n=1 Tax=Krasilnikovia sp. MM14-A1004 TaxID=3373541 RepID=UPI00399D0B27
MSALLGPASLILTALTRGPLSGSAVIREVTAVSEGEVRLQPGTLYGTLDRLAERKLVAVDREEAADGRLRRYYRLTARGRAAAPTSPTRGPHRLAALDGLRLIAALAVAVHHYTTYWALDGVHTPAYFLPDASRVTIYGFLGVELFFMISGFAICMSSWGRTLGYFFASRAGRLYPAYWTCIVATFAVTTLLPISGHIPQRVPLSWADVGVNFTMVQEPLGVPAVDNVYWTLWAELRFYLLFAVVVAWGVTYQRTVIFLLGWLLAACAATSLDVPLLKVITVGEFAGYFVAGVAIYLMHRFGPTPLLWLILGLSWWVNMHRLAERVGPHGFGVALWPAVVIVTLGYAILVLIALGGRGLPGWRWLTLAGALTYPFYLLHQRIGYTIIRYGYELTGLPVGVLIGATVVIMLGPAWLVYRYIERPFGPRLRAALRRAFEPRTRPER